MDRPNLRIRLTQPDFWWLANAYVLIVCGLVIGTSDLVAQYWPGSPWGGATAFSMGPMLMILGFWGLTLVENRRLKRRLAELEARSGKPDG